MIFAEVVLGAPGWLPLAAALTVLALLALARGYWRLAASNRVRRGAWLLKAIGVLTLAFCLTEPLFQGQHARPGANLFVLLADNSQSLQVCDAGESKSRGELLRPLLQEGSAWQTRLAQDFDVRRYCFDARLRRVADFSDLAFDGGGTSLAQSLEAIAARLRGRPLAGVLLLTDGNATDLVDDSVDWSALPPVYPVLVGQGAPERDISLGRLSVSQTNFEEAPVTIQAEIATHGRQGQQIVAQLLDESGKQVQEHTAKGGKDSDLLQVRFQLQPERAGVAFYQVRVSAESEVGQFEAPELRREATLANNSRLVMVDRGGGPYRVLYVSGRPNWEFKFLRRAVEEDAEIELVGLVRIAKREPKFDFRGRTGETTNPLYRGFGNQRDENAQQYDEPVLLRVGKLRDAELLNGFPKTADQLYQYHAVILDDVEAGFFTHDQMTLLRNFVSRRGGGFLMLGGAESFLEGQYQHTPIGDLLPFYLNQPEASPSESGYRWSLTRDGWLQPWVRLRGEEDDEKQRLDAMPAFRTVNRLGGVKPGAAVLARAADSQGQSLPALAAQHFGKGRSAAMAVGDLWRWSMRREINDPRDLEKAWRQTVRWLVADVPRRIECEVRQRGDPSLPVELHIQVRDAEYELMDNASVAVRVTSPDGKQVELAADSSGQQAGNYTAAYWPRRPGAYRARVAVRSADGADVGERLVGWAATPAADEFLSLTPNRGTLEQIARQTGGAIVPGSNLDRFVAGLPNRKMPVAEAWRYPLWHQPLVFLFAAACLIAECGLRRWKGLP